MVFSSLVFLFYFLPIALIVYYISPKFMRNFVIFISGLIFYAWGEPVYVVIMIISTLIDYLCGLLLDKYDDNDRARRFVLLASVVMNLSLLGVFKYGDFIVLNLNRIFPVSLPLPGLPLPIGISFYTFQSMSYTIDLYMRNIKVQKSFFAFAGYVTLFPQIVAGPIVRYQDVSKEIENRTITLPMISDGVAVFIRGLAKKTLLANDIGALWNTVKASPISELSTVTAWLGIMAFSFQIYFDFSGYSDMAVGMGKMLGFHFPKNFDMPYTSKSITEFWRRWHITLGTWFRCYVYIPLGGNRGGNAATIRNLAVVWLITGLWHGASWNFVFWGGYFGLIIIMERFFLARFLERLPSFLQTAYQFILVVFGWVMFEFTEMSSVGEYMRAMLTAGDAGFIDGRAYYFILSYGVVFTVAILLSFGAFKKLERYLKNKNKVLFAVAKHAWMLLLFVVCIAYLVDATYNPFLYFRF